MTASRRVLARAITVVCIVSLVAGLALSALAQQAPVQVVQASDGTLYVVQGSNAWTLIPNQISDSDLAALNNVGELDGILGTPQQAPAAAPAAAATQPPAQASTGCSSPVTGTVDLSGKVASDVPGTCIALGATVSSVVDQTKPKDVYALPLTAGGTYQFLLTSPNKFGNGWVDVTLLNPDSSTAIAGRAGNPNPGCNFANHVDCTYTAASTNIYYLVVSVYTPGARYTLNVKQS
ncbi:MAG: hypothetical protein JOZ81_15045 [Chloroflexi bacterium]|nr:hypothetical protein [Chloroflexota bacterium]